MPAGMANWAQLPSLHLQRVKGKTPGCFRNKLKGEKLASGVSQAWRRKWEEGRKGFRGLYPGLTAALGSNPTQVGSPDHKPPGKWGTGRGRERG